MKKAIAFISLAIFLAVAGLVYLTNEVKDFCSERQTIPSAPEYPLTTVSQSSFYGLDKDYSLISVLLGNRITNLSTITYASSSNREQIFEYYSDLGTCPSLSLCTGTVDDYGNWTVYLRSEGEFSMEIRWESCG